MNLQRIFDMPLKCCVLSVPDESSENFWHAFEMWCTECTRWILREFLLCLENGVYWVYQMNLQRIFDMPLKCGVLSVPEPSERNSMGSWKVGVLGVPDESSENFWYAFQMWCTECTRVFRAKLYGALKTWCTGWIFREFLICLWNVVYWVYQSLQSEIL